MSPLDRKVKRLGVMASSLQTMGFGAGWGNRLSWAKFVSTATNRILYKRTNTPILR